MTFPTVIDSSIRGRMADVTKAFEAGAYLSALALALTIPDICGEHLYPGRKVGHRYKKWFDEYVAVFYLEGIEDDATISAEKRISDVDNWTTEAPCRAYFSGQDCYALRCTFLHEGTNDISNEKLSAHQRTIQFRVFEGPFESDCIGELKEHPSGLCFDHIDLDLGKFIRCLGLGVEEFLNDHPDMNEDKGRRCGFYQAVVDFNEQCK